jgi:hypothetical protein
MGRLRRSVLVLILFTLPGLASTAALGQTIDDLTTVTSTTGVTATTTVTPTLTEVVSGVTEETTLVEGGGGTLGESGGGTSGGALPDVGGPSSGATAPVTSTASSLSGKSGTGSTAEIPKQETQKGETRPPTSIQTISCGEASQDPRTFGAFLLTLKEGERGAQAQKDGGINGTAAGSGVLGATGGDGQQATPSLPIPPAVPDGPDGFPAWLGLVALAALALGFAALLALVAKSFFAERQMATPSSPSGNPTSGGAVRRSL